MAINTQKLLPSSSSATSASIAGDQNRMFKVKTTVIDIEKILKGTIALQKKELDVSRKEREEKKFRKREEDLEKKKYKEDFKIKLPTLPKLGFLDWVKNFVVNTLVGYFVVRLIKYLPQFQGIFSIAGKALDGVTFIGGKLLDGLVTFIDWGYKAYDATRGFLNQIGGDNTLKLFDKFTSEFDKFLTLTLAYNALVGSGDILRFLGTTVGGAFLRPGAAGLTRALGRVPGLSRVVEKVFRYRRFRNIQKARKFQTKAQRYRSALKELRFNKQLLEEIPKSYNKLLAAGASPQEAIEKALSGTMYQGSTATGIKPPTISVKKLPRSGKYSPSGEEAFSAIERQLGLEPKSISQREEAYRIQQAKKAQADIDFAKSRGIDLDPQKMAAARSDVALDELTKGRAGIRGDDLFDAIKNVPSRRKSFLIGTKRFLKAARLPIIGALLDFGISWALGESPGRAAFRAIGAGLFGALGGVIGSVVPVAGSIIGGAIGGAGGDYLGGLLYDAIFTGKKSSGGKTQGFAGGGQATRGGSPVGSSGARTVKKTKRRIEDEPQQSIIKPGADVGGEKQIKKMFPEPKNPKQVNPYQYVQESYAGLSGISYFGPLFGIAIKTLTGDRPDRLDYKNASIGLSNWAIASFGAVGMPGFASGGPVTIGGISDPGELNKMLEKSLEDGISNNVDIAINNLKKRLGFFESIMESDRPGFIPAGGPALGEGELATGLQLMKGLQERGFTKEEAAAIVGNLWAESGFSTGATNPTSGAFGLMQWLGGRKARLYSYAEEKGKPVTDLDLQLDYIKWELKGGNDYETKQFAKAMAYGDDVAAKTRGFAYEVERASSSELSSSMEKRIGAADSVYTGKLVLGERKSPYNFELGKGYGSDGVRIAAELGKYIQQNLRSPEQFQAVTEHPSFGGVSNVHADGSYHYKGRAIDIGAYANEQGPILKVIDDFNKLKGIKPAQVFHAGNDPDGNHQDHIHVAYFHGGPTGKGGLIRVHGNEYVHDKDSVDAFGQPFMDIINQVENVTQRKGAAIALMNILKNYIPEYDSRYEKTVVIPVPQPQMVPVPIPSGGGGGISVMNQSQPSGRTDILNSGS